MFISLAWFLKSGGGNLVTVNAGGVEELKRGLLELLRSD